MLRIEGAEGQLKLRLEGERQEAKRLLLQLYNEIKPNDELVLSLANSVYGTILYFEGEYKGALDALREAVKQNPTNYSAEFNRACCACKLADKLQLMGASEAGALIVALEREALDSLNCVLREEPWRKNEARGEAGEKRDLCRLAANPHFTFLTCEGEISSASSALREATEP
jgi:tetratricopeptide (TPR) repeat protein